MPPTTDDLMLRFSCDHCRIELIVPSVAAGVTGPCPSCGGTITAPQQMLSEVKKVESEASLPNPVTVSPLAMVPPRRHKQRAWPSPLRYVLSGLIAVALLGVSWVVAWQSGHAPQPSLAVLEEWIKGWLAPAPGPTRKMLQVRSDAWNLVMEVPADQWVELHPGGSNHLCSLVNDQNPQCRVVFRASVLGSISKDQGWVGVALRSWLKSGTSLRDGKIGGETAGEDKVIGGRNFHFVREEIAQSSDFFRPGAVTVCTYDLMENNIAYSFEFVGRGKEAFATLPDLAEGVLATMRPLVKDVSITQTNNLTYSDPRLLRNDVGVDLPSPGNGWSIIPDAPTPLALLGSVTAQRTITSSIGHAGERLIASGQLGGPSVGYITEDGDVLGLSVVQLPAELTSDFAHLAEIILAAWFPQVSINRENEKPFSPANATGTEYDGQISSKLNPAPFVFRLVRRGSMVCALGACSFSQKRSKEQLAAMLDQAVWSEPVQQESPVMADHTPLVSVKLWEHLILTIGRERQKANQLAEALNIYQRAFAVRASGAILLSTCETLVQLNQTDQAVALMEKEWGQQELTNAFLTGAADFMAQHQRQEAATKLFTMALNRARDGQDTLKSEMVESYLMKLHDTQAHDEALRVLDLLNNAVPSNHWHLWEAYILYNGPQTKARGIEIMEGLVASMKKNRSLMREFLTFLKNHQCHELGLKAAMGVLRLNPQEGVAWLVRASCEREMGDTAKAGATLAQARQYNPQLRDLDEIVYAMTDDEGGPVLSKDGPQTTPIPLPPELRLLLQREPLDGESNSEVPYQYLYRIRSLTCDPGEPFRSTNRYAIRIQNSLGMEAFNILKISYRPRAERLQVNELKVRTADGKVVSPASMSEAFVTEDNTDGMHTGMKVLNVPVPGLAPGCVLEYTVTEESMGLLAGSINSCFHFAMEAPCALDVLYLNSPVAKLDYRHSTGAAPSKISTGMVWVERKLPALTRETHQPSLEKMVPVLWTGDGSESWSRLGADYFSTIHEKLRPDEAITRLAKEKTRGCKNDTERVAVLSEYVRSVLSYAAIEFGMRAFVPNTAGESVKNRYGDCKDHSVLLFQLLKAVGIPARLVLANATTAVQPDLPSLGAFNHMITAVPGTEKGSWDFIDCTNKCMAPQPGVPPWMLAGQYALVLGEHPSDFNAESSRLVKIRGFPDDFDKVTVDRTAQILEGRNLHLKESITIQGVLACELRQILGGRVDRHDTSLALKSLLGLDRNRCQVELAQAENLTALDKPLILQLEYTMRNACVSNGSSFVAHLPTLAEMHFLDPDTVGEARRAPFQFQGPLRIHSRNRLFGNPQGHLAPSELSSDEQKFIKWSYTQENREGSAEVSLDLTRKAGTYTAAEYPEFQSQLMAATQPIEEITFLPASASVAPVSQNEAPSR